MPNTRTLADIWPQLGQDERLAIFLDRFDAECIQPSTLRSAGYADCIKDLRFFVLDPNPLPGEDAN